MSAGVKQKYDEKDDDENDTWWRIKWRDVRSCLLAVTLLDHGNITKWSCKTPLYSEKDLHCSSSASGSLVQVTWIYNWMINLIFPPKKLLPTCVAVSRPIMDIISSQDVLRSRATESAKIFGLRGLRPEESGRTAERSKRSGHCWLWRNGRSWPWWRHPGVKDEGNRRGMEETKGAIRGSKLVWPLLHLGYSC